MKNILLLLMLVILCMSSCSSRQKTDANNTGLPVSPNIILIMADDLGYGDISCYGSLKINTPHLDQMASEGIKFSDFHSNGPVCSPTRAALLTGKYQQRTGVEGVVTAAKHRHVGLSLEETTLAEELKKLNYTCGIFGKWHLGYAPQFNPSLQGFDQFVGFVSGNVDYHSHVDLVGVLDWWKDTLISNQEGYTTDLITQYGVDFIEQHKEGPFFLYLAQEAPHSPFQGRNDKPLRRIGGKGTDRVPVDSIPGIYKEMVEVMDEGIGRIMQTLKETGIDDHTLVIFCSDNGAAAYGNVGVLRGKKGGVYEGGHRVPAIIRYPKQIRAGRVSDEPVISMDFYPSILDIAGIDLAGKELDGISIKDLLLEEEELPERDLFWSFNGRHALRSGPWKLVVTGSKDKEKTELFNLDEDLSEAHDMAGEHPDLAAQLKQKLDQWQKEVREGVERVSP